MVKETCYIIKLGCVATFKKRQESDGLGSTNLRLMQPPRTAGYGNELHLLTCPHQRDHPLS